MFHAMATGEWLPDEDTPTRRLGALGGGGLGRLGANDDPDPDPDAAADDDDAPDYVARCSCAPTSAEARCTWSAWAIFLSGLVWALLALLAPIAPALLACHAAVLRGALKAHAARALCSRRGGSQHGSSGGAARGGEYHDHDDDDDETVGCAGLRWSGSSAGERAAAPPAGDPSLAGGDGGGAGGTGRLTDRGRGLSLLSHAWPVGQGTRASTRSHAGAGGGADCTHERAISRPAASASQSSHGPAI